MNNPMSCFYVIKAADEAAQVVASIISPASANDIIEVTLQSGDFEHDIGALHSMDAIIKQATDGLHEVVVNEQFNPLFLPQRMGELDEMLELHPRHDGVRFTGLDGSPFTIKLTDVRRDAELLVVGKTQYHPFELPAYSEIVDAHEHTSLN